MNDKEKPVSVLDVAAYIVCKQTKEHPLTAWKLQKLVYYSQAWSLVWDEAPLFNEQIEAWANGPVCPDLYKAHRGKFTVGSLASGDPKKLTRDQQDTINAVIMGYGDKSSQWLSDLTHMEAPWRDARAAAGLADGVRGNAVISLGAMADYYGSL